MDIEQKVGGKKRMNIALLIEAIRKSWCRETCYLLNQEKWSSYNPAFGQCAVSTLFIQDFLGGEILYCKHYRHYWNKLADGTILDLTKEQFGKNVNLCLDKIASRKYILESEQPKKVETLKRYLLLKRKVNEILKRGGVL